MEPTLSILFGELNKQHHKSSVLQAWSGAVRHARLERQLEKVKVQKMIQDLESEYIRGNSVHQLARRIANWGIQDFTKYRELGLVYFPDRDMYCEAMDLAIAAYKDEEDSDFEFF